MILFALQWRIAGGKGAREKKEIQAGEGGREAGGLRCGQDVLICSSKEQSGRAGRAELERTPPHARQEGLLHCAKNGRTLFGRGKEKPLRFSSGQLSG